MNAFVYEKNEFRRVYMEVSDYEIINIVTVFR